MQPFSQGAVYNIEWRAKNTGTTLYIVQWYSSHKRTDSVSAVNELLFHEQITQDFCSHNVNELKSLSHTPVFPINMATLFL